MKQKKLYLVKREVYATSVKQALTAKGRVYAVEEGTDTEESPRKIGFIAQKHDTKPKTNLP